MGTSANNLGFTMRHCNSRSFYTGSEAAVDRICNLPCCVIGLSGVRLMVGDLSAFVALL